MRAWWDNVLWCTAVRASDHQLFQILGDIAPAEVPSTRHSVIDPICPVVLDGDDRAIERQAGLLLAARVQR
jgi:hypothetical protein